MRFWDASALVPLLIDEPATGPVIAAYRRDPVVIVAWTTAIECASALARAERDRAIDAQQAAAGFDRLDELMQVWHEVQPGPAVQHAARRILRGLALRAGDALQLASAVQASAGTPRSLPFVTLDARLEDAARREGFLIVRIEPE